MEIRCYDPEPEQSSFSKRISPTSSAVNAGRNLKVQVYIYLDYNFESICLNETSPYLRPFKRHTTVHVYLLPISDKIRILTSYYDQTPQLTAISLPAARNLMDSI